MNDILFYNSFGFKVVSLTGNRHTDNSKGIDCHFFARMICGNGRIITNKKDVLELQAGDVFYLPKGLKYNSYWYGDSEKGNKVEWESYRFTVIPDSLEISYKMGKIILDGEGEEILNKLSESKETSSFSVGLLYLFCNKVLPMLEIECVDHKEAMLRKIKDYISDNIDFSVPELAKHVGISESGVYAFLKRYAGTTPVSMKNKLKAERAAILLETTDISVEDISTMLGFGSSAYFREVIKQYLGKTPMAVRKEAKLI